MTSIDCTLVPGRQLASGSSSDCRYPTGTINLQKAAFLKCGVDITRFHNGTLNLALDDKKIVFPENPQHCLNSEWFPGKFETFLMAPVKLTHGGKTYDGMVYQPSLIREIGPKPAPRFTEILAPKIEGIKYGDKVELTFDEKQCAVITGEEAIERMRSIQGDLGAKTNMSQETASARVMEMATLKYRIALQFPDAAPLLAGVGQPVVKDGQVDADSLAVAVAQMVAKDPKAPKPMLSLANELLSSIAQMKQDRTPASERRPLVTPAPRRLGAAPASSVAVA